MARNKVIWQKPKANANAKSTASDSASSGAQSVNEKSGDVTEHRRPSETPSNRAEAILEEVKEETAAHEGEDELEYPRAWKLAAITAALMLSVFCMALDNTIIATAIPRITDQFNSIDDVGK